MAQANAIDLTGTTLVFYEVHGLEFDDAESQWRTFNPEPSFTTQVVLPIEKVLKGCDVVTFSAGTGAEYSPLSCNALAADLETNQHCLLISFERATNCWRRGDSRTRNLAPIGISPCIRWSGPNLGVPRSRNGSAPLAVASRRSRSLSRTMEEGLEDNE